MKLTLFEAGKGDSFLLSWGEKFEKNILIDGGTPNTYRFIRRQIKKLNAIIVTHVDNDHIGGIIKLYKDESRDLDLDFPIFVNTPQLILTPNSSEMVNLEHGEILSEILKQLNVIPSGMHIGSFKNNELEIDGLKLTILSPNQMVLEELMENWTAKEILEVSEKENQVDEMVSRDVPKLKPIEAILKEKEETKNWKSDLINASSISFIAHSDEKKILFLADSNPNLICEELEKLGFDEKNPLEVEYVKLSHHGCKHNTSIDLLKRIKTNKYIISTNGAGPYYHPHRETIIKIAHYGRKIDDNKNIEFITNYEIDKTQFISDGEIIDLKINIYKRIENNI